MGNRYFLLILIVVMAVMWGSVALGLSYWQGAVLWQVVAWVLAPVALHRVPDRNGALGLLVGLAFFASLPIRRMYGLEGLFQALPAIVAQAAVLFVVGGGWRRDWSGQG